MTQREKVYRDFNNKKNRKLKLKYFAKSWSVSTSIKYFILQQVI